MPQSSRRAFLAAIGAFFAARFVPKPKPQSIYELVNSRMEAAYAEIGRQVAENMFRPNPLFYHLQQDGIYDGGTRISEPLVYDNDTPWYGDEEED